MKTNLLFLIILTALCGAASAQDPVNIGGQVPTLELFDLQSDPDELHNLAADPAHRQPLERLFAALKQWSADTQDTSTPLPLKP